MKTCKKFLEEIGFDYEKNEPLIYKIELIEKQMDEKNNKIKEMNEELNQKKMEISEKNKGIEELQNLQIDNGILKLELKKKEKCIKSLAEEIMQLKTVFYSHELEKEKKFKVIFFIFLKKFE